MSLYEISERYYEFMKAVEDGDIPQEAVNDTLMLLNEEANEKIDNCACYIKNLLAEAEAIKAEEKALMERRKAKENAAERIKKSIDYMMNLQGKDKFETARNRISYRKSEQLVILDELQFIHWAEQNADGFLNYKDPDINKTTIKNAIKAGEKIPFTSIVTKQNLQIK